MSSTLPLQFRDHFWSENEKGFAVLINKLTVSTEATRELTEFFQARTVAEDEYVKYLSRMLKDHVLKSEAGTVRSAMDKITSSTETFVRMHQQLANKIREDLETPVVGFRDRQRRLKKTAAKEYIGRCKDYVQINDKIGKSNQDGMHKKDWEKLQDKAVKLKIEMERSELELKATLIRLSQLQDAWEQKMSEIADLVQRSEETRIELTKQCLRKVLDVQYDLLHNMTGKVLDGMRKVCESIDVVADNNAFVQREKTGSEPPARLMFRSFFDSGGIVAPNESSRTINSAGAAAIGDRYGSLADVSAVVYRVNKHEHAGVVNNSPIASASSSVSIGALRAGASSVDSLNSISYMPASLKASREALPMAQNPSVSDAEKDEMKRQLEMLQQQLKQQREQLLLLQTQKGSDASPQQGQAQYNLQNASPTFTTGSLGISTSTSFSAVFSIESQQNTPPRSMSAIPEAVIGTDAKRQDTASERKSSISSKSQSANGATLTRARAINKVTPVIVTAKSVPATSVGTSSPNVTSSSANTPSTYFTAVEPSQSPFGSQITEARNSNTTDSTAEAVSPIEHAVLAVFEAVRKSQEHLALQKPSDAQTKPGDGSGTPSAQTPQHLSAPPPSTPLPPLPQVSLPAPLLQLSQELSLGKSKAADRASLPPSVKATFGDGIRQIHSQSAVSTSFASSPLSALASSSSDKTIVREEQDLVFHTPSSNQETPTLPAWDAADLESKSKHQGSIIVEISAPTPTTAVHSNDSPAAPPATETQTPPSPKQQQHQPVPAPTKQLAIPHLEKRTYMRRSIKQESWLEIYEDIVTPSGSFNTSSSSLGATSPIGMAMASPTRSTGWRKQWCVLEGGYLWFFDSPEDNSKPQGLNKPRGMVTIAKTVVEVGGGDGEGGDGHEDRLGGIPPPPSFEHDEKTPRLFTLILPTKRKMVMNAPSELELW
ncbi:proline-serine-threonine phosphatase interacting protein [Quaeritorhiza haematococci]|nr:proline-serine-threonine phosphatase interacting protein [Quaeritorhiza haematococci]